MKHPLTACACVALLLTFAGCGLLELEAKVQSAKDLGDAAIKIARDADTNADGMVSWLEGLIALGAAFGVGGGWIVRRNMASNVAKAAVVADVASLKENQVWLEGEVEKKKNT